MCEEAAAYQVEAVIPEGKSKRIGDNRAVSALQVRGQAVEIRDIERDSSASQLLSGSFWDFAESGCHFQQGEMFLRRGGGHLLDQLSCGSYSAKPPVNAAEIAQRGFHLGGRASVGVKDFLRVSPQHVV